MVIYSLILGFRQENITFDGTECSKFLFVIEKRFEPPRKVLRATMKLVFPPEIASVTDLLDLEFGLDVGDNSLLSFIRFVDFLPFSDRERTEDFFGALLIDDCDEEEEQKEAEEETELSLSPSATSPESSA